MQDAVLGAVEARRDELVALTRELVSFRSENPKLLVDADYTVIDAVHTFF
jgi:hypothetical protein